MLKTAVVTDRRYLKHFAGRSHPERPDRIEVMIEMAESLRRPDLKFLTPRAATTDEIAMCHGVDYIHEVERTASLDRFDFDLDTHSSRDSYETALLAAGGVLTAVEAVMDGAANNAFAIVRPPGHHALPNRAMGFCFFNNLAIAAEWLIKVRGLKRVMIVDWDVHHGNGSQDMFYESAEVLYTSIHQFPHYPGTGSTHEIGYGPGTGYTVNMPMPAEFGDSEYLRAFDRLIMPIGRHFKPEFILVSAGFGAMARRVTRLAAECCDGKVVAALEGGYDLEAIAGSGRAVIEEFGRDGDEPIRPDQNGDRVMPMIERVSQNVGRFWNLR